MRKYSYIQNYIMVQAEVQSMHLKLYYITLETLASELINNKVWVNPMSPIYENVKHFQMFCQMS